MDRRSDKQFVLFLRCGHSRHCVSPRRAGCCEGRTRGEALAPTGRDVAGKVWLEDIKITECCPSTPRPTEVLSFVHCGERVPGKSLNSSVRLHMEKIAVAANAFIDLAGATVESRLYVQIGTQKFRRRTEID